MCKSLYNNDIIITEIKSVFFFQHRKLYNVVLLSFRAILASALDLTYFYAQR